MITRRSWMVAGASLLLLLVGQWLFGAPKENTAPERQPPGIVTERGIILPTLRPTPNATLAKIAFPTLTPTPLPIIIDFSAVLNSSIEDVEKYLGKPYYADSARIGEFPDSIPNGGEVENRLSDDLEILIFYDKQRIAKSMLVFGLEKYGYEIMKWMNGRSSCLGLGFRLIMSRIEKHQQGAIGKTTKAMEFHCKVLS